MEGRVYLTLSGGKRRAEEKSTINLYQTEPFETLSFTGLSFSSPSQPSTFNTESDHLFYLSVCIENYLIMKKCFPAIV